MSKWFGPNNEEFRCHGRNPDGTFHDCGLNVMDEALVDMADDVRDELGFPLVVNCGSRCPVHNEDVGGVMPDADNPWGSAHLPGPDGKSHAIDFRCTWAVTRAKIHEAFRKRGIVRFEVSNKHIHVDNAEYLPKPVLDSVFFKG